MHGRATRIVGLRAELVQRRGTRNITVREARQTRTDHHIGAVQEGIRRPSYEVLFGCG